MRYKRNESFRYEFETPVEVEFRIIQINGVETSTNLAKAKLHNISPHGISLLSDLDVHIDSINKIQAEFHIFLYEEPIVVNGYFVYQKKESNGFRYGIELEASEEVQRKVIEELKKFTKGTVYVKGKR